MKLLLLFAPLALSSSLLLQNDASNNIVPHKLNLVKLQLGGMSLCPDFKLFADVLDRVFDLENSKLVDLEVLYIGSVVPKTKEKEEQLVCKHGLLECEVNIKELCVQKHWRSEELGPAWLESWNFINCLNWGSPVSKIGEEAELMKCSKLLGRDWNDKKIQSCINGEEGRDLLKHSILKSQELKLRLSATLLIDGKLACIHDSVWKNCSMGHEVSDFRREIAKASAELNP